MAKGIRPGGAAAAANPGKGLVSAGLVRWLEGPAQAYLADPNVVGVGLGEKIRAGARTDEIAIVFHVRRKLAAPGDILTVGSVALPAEVTVDGRVYPTDVLESAVRLCDGVSPGLGARRRRQPAIAPGLSIGNVGATVSFGTSGAIVRHRPTGQLALLSCGHVLTRFDGTKGVSQPGGGDNGDPERDWFGDVLASFTDSDGDGAIAAIERRTIEPRIFGLGVAVEAVAAPQLGMRVVKAGRTTGITFGRVSKPMHVQSIPFPGEVFPVNTTCCEIEMLPAPPAGESPAVAQPGDSGSAWMLLGPDGKPTTTMIAMTVAVTPNGSRAFACLAERVFGRLDIEPVTAAMVEEEVQMLAEQEAQPQGIPAPDASSVLPQPGKRLFVGARNGLFLRAGPGQSFDKVDLLPFGTGVFTLGIDGQWVKVDLQGDGKADGFMFGAFLEAEQPVAPDVVLSPAVAAGPTAFATVDTVARMCPASPRSNIVRHLPHILEGLRSVGLTDRDMFLVAIATVRAEVEPFRPMDELVSTFNTAVTPFDRYEPGTSVGIRLGNSQPGDGARFKGRGFIQLTGRDNYRRMGGQLGLDLLSDPALANRADIAGLILARFLKNGEARLRSALAAGDLAAARRVVNGGTHGLPRFEGAFRIGRSLIG